jgi:thiol-disulfide isomerase/thioredoxin
MRPPERIPSMTAYRTSREISPSLAGAVLLALFAVLATPGPAAAGDDELVSLARSRHRALIADFGLGLCKQCKAQGEILDRIQGVYKDRVIVRKVHVNKEQELTARYRVEMIPHLVFFDPAGKVTLRRTGVMNYEDVSAQLSRMGIKP